MHARRLSALLLLGLLSLPLAAQAGGAFMVRGGEMRLKDTSQTFDDLERDLDTRSHGVFTVSVEGRFRNGIALGAEYLAYRNDFNPPAGNTGETHAKIVQFIVKKYFLDGIVHPFIGFGVGAGETGFTYVMAGSKESDRSFTAAVQLNVGVEFRIQSLALALEIKHLAHDINRDWNDFNASATGLFAGVGFTW